MSEFFSIHPDNPQARLLRQAAYLIQEGGLVVYPTDSGYALGCQLGNKQALKRIRRIRQLEEGHNMTLVCRDLSDLGTYAKFDNMTFRLLKAFTPGPYTFILQATNAVPRLMLHPKRRTLGLRIPDHTTAMALLEELDAPLSEPAAIHDLLGDQVDLIIDGGPCGLEPTTIVDLVSGLPKVLRVGKGDPTPFE